jgi:hypothetical protein
MGYDRSDPGREGTPASWAWAVFLAAMALSSIFVLWVGKDVRFTADEMTLISEVAEMRVGDLFDPYVGHLVLVPLLAYKVLIETAGTGAYAPFQLLTLAAIFLLGAGVLVWGSRQLPQAVALVPAVLLVFFPADVLHFIAGNGFTVVLPLALGTWALVLWDRRTPLGDIGASILLILAMSTYTVGVAFAVGIALVALLGDRRRLWVPGLPLLAYGAWRVLIASQSTDVGDVGPVWSNILLLPAWAFQSVGDILVALLGIGFDFAGARDDGGNSAADFAAPTFAVGFFIWVMLRFRRGPMGSAFWTVSAISIALFASQVLVWGSLEGRGEPGEERYLYPGAAVVLLVAIELARGITWTRAGLATLWSATAIALVSATGFLINEVDRREAGTGMARAQVTAMQILASSPSAPPDLQRAKTIVKNEFDPIATSRFEGLGFSEGSLPAVRPLFRGEVDRFLATALALDLERLPVGREIGPCSPARRQPGSGSRRAVLPDGEVILKSTRDLEVRLGRYGRAASWPLGPLWANQPARLFIPTDAGTRPWFVQVDAGSAGGVEDLLICRPPRD